MAVYMSCFFHFSYFFCIEIIFSWFLLIKNSVFFVCFAFVRVTPKRINFTLLNFKAIFKRKNTDNDIVDGWWFLSIHFFLPTKLKKKTACHWKFIVAHFLLFVEFRAQCVMKLIKMQNINKWFSRFMSLGSTVFEMFNVYV